MDESIRDSERLTDERHRHQHRNIRKKLYCATPEGVAVTGDLLLQPLIDFLKDPDNPFRPPSELEERLHRIPDHHPHVALAILAPVLDGFARDREDDQGFIINRKGVIVPKLYSRTPLAEALGTHLLGWLVHKEREMAEAEREAERARRYKELTGKKLPPRKGRPPSRRRFNHSDWTASECVAAGDWMLRIALSLPCFGEDEDGRIYITTEWQDKIDKICDDLLRRHPVMLPHREPPPDWTEWWKHSGDRLRAKFIRSCHPDTKKAIEDNFAVAARPLDVSGPLAELHHSIPFAHAVGLNALKNVPLRANQDLVPLVHKFAVELMGHVGDKRTADRKTVRADLVHARWCDKEPIHLDYNCDDRGRVYSIQHLNFGREDHVRGLFEFARGAPLSADAVGGRDAMHWLEIHAANCYGLVDKKPWSERLRWTTDNKDRIERVAANPQDNFDLWREADNPFAFVAACIELSRARKNPIGFETHLPIPFDGSCNAIQHLAMLSRDAEVGRLVNLTNTDTPQDIYSVVIAHIMEMLAIGDKRLGDGPRAVEHFKWWLNRLSELNEKQRRKLLKTPVMTFAYGSTVMGMRDEIVKTHADLLPNRTWPTDAAATFLAQAVRLACKDKLPGPTRIMDYIHDLARYRLKQKHGKFLKLRGPTGFPLANICYETNIVDIDLQHGGIRSRYTVADGDLPEIDESGVITQSVPNFVHFLDATHLIFTVLAANSDSEGIHDIIPVHDSYACLAPYAQRFGQIIRAQMAMLYDLFDPLRALRDANVDDPNILPLPLPVCPEIVPLLNPLDVQNAEYAFM
jgi:DNA-directed RNA polymerase